MFFIFNYKIIISQIMNQIFQNTDFYTIMRLMPISDDIKHKILMLLLSITGTPTANRVNCLKYVSDINHGLKTEFRLRFRHVCGLQYEINAIKNSLREAILCEIRIAEFDRDVSKKKMPGAITNIIRYKELLAKRFIKRHFALFK